MKNINIAYVVSDLKRVGPSNQTLNIIKNSIYKDSSIVITLFNENINDSMIEEYRDNNIKVICLGLNRITFSIFGKKKLIDVLKDNKIDIIHSYGVKPDYICHKTSKKYNVKHIITLRNYPKEDILTRMSFIKGRIALRNHLKTLLNSDNVVCCSKTIYEKMKKDYPSKKFSFIQNGVDINKYNMLDDKEKNNLRRKYKFNSKKKIYISTGSFIPRKRIDETIEGFLLSGSEDILLLLGEGMLFENIRNKYQDNKKIIFYGKSNKVNELLQLSDYFVSSSESEGLPNGVIEAISTGLPVILSDIPQHLEVLENTLDAGIHYPLGDIESLSKCFNDIKNYKFRCDIKKSPFTMVNMSSKYCDLYKKVKGR